MHASVVETIARPRHKIFDWEVSGFGTEFGSEQVRGSCSVSLMPWDWAKSPRRATTPCRGITELQPW